MKSIILSALIFCLAIFSAKANINTENTKLTQLLHSYYEIKDALAADNAELASAKATEFVKTANSIDYKVISEGNITVLVKDAGKISETKDIIKQRKSFVNLSENMFVLAKTMKLADETIYRQYCPMKKTYWLSKEEKIKNPYYGKTMLGCGEVKETIK
jgi:hypothetical protein